MARKLSSITAAEMDDLDDELEVTYLRFANADGMDQQGLCNFAIEADIIDKKLTLSEIQLLFARVKLGKRKTLSFDRFQEAVRKMAVTKGVTYQELIEHLKAHAGAEIRVLVCTWNIGNAQPPDDLDPWIPKDGGGFGRCRIGEG